MVMEARSKTMHMTALFERNKKLIKRGRRSESTAVSAAARRKVEDEKTD
jgi:hypothetical protein